MSVHGLDVWMARSDCSRGTRTFQMSKRTEHEEETGGRHPCARKAGDEAAGRRGLFREDQDSQSGDPQHIHDAGLTAGARALPFPA
jgi:hypothetical protein